MTLCGGRLWSLASLLLILGTEFKQTLGQVGIAYSPFVKDEDFAGTTSYTRADVKVMLKIVEEKGYHEITTYGVGVPSNLGTYRPNDTWKQSSSIIHTALAAAEINRDSRNLRLTVYQGLYKDAGTPEEQIKSEIKVGFEIAEMANSIYRGTVKGIVFPSITTVDSLVKNLEQVSSVSAEARRVGLLFGARISDCSTISRSHQSLEVLKLMNFIICQMLPNVNQLIIGPQNFLNSTTRNLNNVKETIQKSVESNSSPLKIILETGWPGGENLGQVNTDIWTMLKFWNLTQKWSTEHGQQIFMHEGFNNPWKREHNHNQFLFGEYFGRWKHTEANDNSQSAYELKVGVEPTSNSNSNGGLSKELLFGIVFGLLLFVVLAIMILVVYRRVQIMHARGKLSEEEIRQFLNGTVINEVVKDDDKENAWTRIPYNQNFELPKDKFSIDKSVLLGSGAFGSVYRGRVEGLVNDVAFKMTRPDCPVTALRGLLSEIKILMYLGKHDNVVSICGAYTVELQNGIVYVATELCSNGSLEKFLRENKSTDKTYYNEMRYVAAPSSLHPEQITDYQLIRWALEIASAMEYISSKNIIHADLATRNVLLTLNLTAKVTDFGLSRRLYEYTEYVKKQQEPLPWRWMAVESLKQLEFSIKSDVWSYGITLWEIFSLGDIPYPGLTWDIGFVAKLENGLRLQQPSRASTDNLYEIMTDCWNIEPTNRPSFPVLKDAFLSLSNQLHNYVNNEVKDLR